MEFFPWLRAARRAVTAPAVATVAAAAVAGAMALSGAPAMAPAGLAVPAQSVRTANAHVQAILAQIHALSGQVAAAEKRYAVALQGVAASVNESISASRDRDAIKALVSASRDTLQQQVVDLYASGGGLAAEAALLQPSGGLDAYDQSTYALAGAITQTEATAKEQSAAESDAAQAVTAAGRSAVRRIKTERSVAGVAAHVAALLTQQEALLAKAQQQLADAKAVAAAQAALAAESAQFASDTTAGVTAVGILPPSAMYLALYQHAATTCPGLPWTVLAAIGQVESGHGRNDGPSSAGAEGPMQFEPATFTAYAVDGDHNGSVDIDDPADAIYTAAHYLCANGGGRGSEALANAVLHYNHAAWYVDLVLGLAQKYAAAYGS